MSVAAGYLMDDPREASRLADKVDATSWVERYVVEHLGQAPRVLDVGCGPGVIAAALAQRAPGAEVIGLDSSPQRIESAARNLGLFEGSRAVLGDARELPFETGQFDFVYCRFLLEYLAERERALAEMVRVTRPGGRVLLQDLDGQLVWHYPLDELLEASLQRVMAVLEKTGFDAFVGRKLYSLARAAGLQDVQVRAEAYHLVAGTADPRTLAQWTLKLDIAEPVMARALGGLEAARDVKHRFLDYLRCADTLTYSTVFTVWGTKPSS
jgi:ubiquinone/menaquinone biosynthesis C-methylase UbiE